MDSGTSWRATLGHGYVETTPALAPLVLEGDRHAGLAGVSHDAALSLRVNGAIATRVEGALLWTHFGVSGPRRLEHVSSLASGAPVGRRR